MNTSVDACPKVWLSSHGRFKETPDTVYFRS